MATVTINLSQSVIDNTSDFVLRFPALKLADMVGNNWLIDYGFLAEHAGSATAAITSSDARFTYGDGSTLYYSGLAFADPNAVTGHASASSVVDTAPGIVSLTRTGKLDYSYSLANGQLLLTPTGSTITKMVQQSLLPTTDSSYNAKVGNMTTTLLGNISQDAAGNFAGTVSSLSVVADKLVASGSVVGNFNISGSVAGVVSGTNAIKVSGLMSTFTQNYTDGSAINVSGAAVAVSGSSIIDRQLFGSADNWGGSDTFNVTLAASVPDAWLVASGEGNDSITLKGGGGKLGANGGNGSDTITLLDDGHGIDGGAGMDTVFLSGNRAAYTVGQASGGFTVKANGSGAIDTLAGVERLHFNDTMVALDINGIGGQAYRLYQAAFNRAPDLGGLGFWIYYMDKGMSLNDVAQQFMASPEFKGLYGNAPTNADFVDRLYHNVLHRSGEAEGVNFWMDYLTNGGGTQAKVLAFFGESPENQAALIGTIGSGFSYTASLG